MKWEHINLFTKKGADLFFTFGNVCLVEISHTPKNSMIFSKYKAMKRKVCELICEQEN